MFSHQPARRATRASTKLFVAPPPAVILHVPHPNENPETFVPRCYGCGGKLHQSVQDGLLYCMDSQCVAGPRNVSAAAPAEARPPAPRYSILRRPPPSSSPSPATSPQPSPLPVVSPQPSETANRDMASPLSEDDDQAARILMHLFSEGAATPDVTVAKSATRMFNAAPPASETYGERQPNYYMALLAPPVCPSCHSSAHASRGMGELQYRCTNKSDPECAKALF